MSRAGWAKRSEARRGAFARARVALSALLVALLVVPVLPAQALVSTTITIDSDMADWTGVRADPENTSRDTQITDPDPDYPGQPDRDVYIVNATWDSEFLYLAYRRTSGGTKAITFGAYIDRDGDGLLQDTDLVVCWTVNQSAAGRYADAHASSPTARIFNYNQAVNGKGGPYTHPGGDPMGHDGETPDGWADIQSGQILPVKAMDGWFAPNGIEFEGRVAWSDLGLAPGSPIAMHFVNSNGESFGTKWVPSTTRKWTGQPPQYLEENRGQVEDNIEDIWWLRQRGVSVTPDRSGGGDAGTTVSYTHTVTNSSNTTDTFDLTANSSASWPTSITAVGGAPLSSVTLGPGQTTTVTVNVGIPAGTSDGARDLTTLSAVSQTVSTVTDSVADWTSCGKVTVTPDQSGSIAPGQTISYTFTVQNNLPSAGVYDLSTMSTLGFDRQLTTLSGAPLSSVSLASGESTSVVVRVSVPSTATVGMQDVTRLTAALQGAPTIRASATATTRVLGPLQIAPNNVGFGGANTSLFYPHTITNSWPTTRTVSLSATSSAGWPLKFYAADGVTQITSVTVGPNGATADILVRVTIPAGTAAGASDVTTVTATAGANVVTATDRTTVRALSTYENAGYAVFRDSFDLTSTVFARGTGLNPNSTVYFVWKDPSGTVMRTSPGRTVDTAGMAFDEYPAALNDPTGQWTVELHSGSPTGPLLETSLFFLNFKAEITELTATDAPGVGDDVDVTSTTENFIGKDITDSTMTYVIWWDSDGDGVFGAGDIWIDSTGAPHTWDGTSAVSTHVTTGIDVPGKSTWSETSPWTVNNAQFPNQGTYNVTATWRDSDGNVIDEKTTQFYSIPTLGWVVFGLVFGGAALVFGRRLRFLPQGGDAA